MGVVQHPDDILFLKIPIRRPPLIFSKPDWAAPLTLAIRIILSSGPTYTTYSFELGTEKKERRVRAKNPRSEYHIVSATGLTMSRILI